MMDRSEGSVTFVQCSVCPQSSFFFQHQSLARARQQPPCFCMTQVSECAFDIIKHLSDIEDKEFKETIMNVRKKLKTPVVLAVFCKIAKKNCVSGASNKIKTRFAGRIFTKSS